MTNPNTQVTPEETARLKYEIRSHFPRKTADQAIAVVDRLIGYGMKPKTMPALVVPFNNQPNACNGCTLIYCKFPQCKER